MEKLFTQQISKMVASGRFSSENELYVHIMLQISAVTAGLMHVFLFLVMLFLGVYPLLVVNAGSIFCYVVMYSIVKFRRAYFPAGILVAVEVLIYIPLAIYFVGMNTFGFMLYFVLIFMQWNVAYTSTKNIGILTGVIWLAVMATLTFGIYVTPVYPIHDNAQILFLSLFNINLTFSGLAVAIYITSLVRTTITESTAAQLRQYKALAAIDALTELPNRRSADLFIADLTNSEADRIWCVAMLDIDDFKRVNDNLGHLVGDEVLRHLAMTLSSKLRRTDVIFRWGGEEFLLFLADVDLDAAQMLLDKIRTHIAQNPIPTNGDSIPITVTIGAALVNTNDVQASIDLCDQRLYDGKRNGKNQVVAH